MARVLRESAPVPLKPTAATPAAPTGRPNDRLGNTVCTYYLSGLCRFGDGCRFRHVKALPWAVEFFEDVMKDYEGFVKEERENIINSSIEDDYKTFLDKNEEEMEKQFNIKHNFQTSVRGFKSRGNFATQEEAEMRAKLLRETDSSFDVFVGPVGQWLCWDPEAYKTGRVEYMEEELNQLAQEKQKNESVAKSAFEQRVKETKQKAIDDNKKNAEKHGSTITQDIDKDGNLIGAEDAKFAKNDAISAADIRSELFDGENIVIGQSDYGRSELLSGPFAIKKNEDSMERVD
jgi:hypothetical protein